MSASPISDPGAQGSAAYTFSLTDSADDSVRKSIAAALIQYNVSKAGSGNNCPLVITVHGGDNAVMGGLLGATAYGWLYTQMLVMPQNLRGRGVGTELMQRAEQEALRRGCRNAWVDTQFGARGFYERLGYECFGELPDYPPGFSRTFLKKLLIPG